MDACFSQQTFFGRKLIIAFLAFAIAVMGLVVGFDKRADAAGLTCEWTGLGANNNWSTVGNWSDCAGGAPTDGDNLLFTVDPARTTSNNNISGLNLDSVFIQASDMTFTGNAIALTSSIQAALYTNGQNNDWGITTTFNGSANRQIYAYSDGDNTISGDVILNITGSGNFFIGNNFSDTSLDITGDISGSVANIVYANNGGGEVIYNGTNSFTAHVVSGSQVTCNTDTCLGDAANLVTINGNQITFNPVTFDNDIEFSGGGSGLASYGAVTLTGDITINASTITLYANTDSDLSYSGDIDVNTFSVYFLGPGTHTQNGVMSGSGDINVEATTTFAGNNTFTSDIEVQFNETLTVAHNNGLGTTAGTTTIQDQASLVAGTSFGLTTIPENITVEGTGVSGSGAIQKLQSNGSATILSGTITLSDDVYFFVDGNTELSFSGQITGTGDITFGGGASNGRASYTGTVANDYDGDTILENLSSLTLNKSDDVIAVPGDLIVHGDTGPSVLIPYSDEQIADDSHVTLNAENASANIYAPVFVIETIGMLEGDGEVQLENSATTIKVGADNSSGEFSGSIGAAGATFIKVGSGVWTLSGTNNARSSEFVNYVVQEGELLANFSDSSGENTPFYVDGGLVGGTGIIGDTEVVDGNVAPGNSPGCLNPASLTLNSATTLDIEIDGATACTGYDVVDVAGAVDLGSATLNVDLSYTPAPGTVFTIVQGSSLTGTFTGHANNTTFTSGSTQLTISYTSTSVVLTVGGSAEGVPAPTSANGSLSATGIAAGLIVTTALMMLIAGLVLRRSTRFSS